MSYYYELWRIPSLTHFAWNTVRYDAKAYRIPVHIRLICNSCLAHPVQVIPIYLVGFRSEHSLTHSPHRNRIVSPHRLNMQEMWLPY